MTDFCWNELKVVGCAADLDALLGKIRRGPDGFGGTQLLLLESLAPCQTAPIVLTEEEEAAGIVPQPARPPIEEQIRRWGTKWGDMDTEVQRRTSRSLTFGFSTPWGPPLAGIDAIARDYPHLRFRLSARGPDDDRIRATWENGERVEGRTPEILPGVTVERLVLDLLAGGDLPSFLRELHTRHAAQTSDATQSPTIQRLAAKPPARASL